MPRNTNAAQQAAAQARNQVNTAAEATYMTLQEACDVYGFNSVDRTVKVNKNGYPFITFLDTTKPRGEQATNVYFSKAAAAEVKEGEKLSAQDMADLTVCMVKNAAGESRLKLSFGGESSYESLDSIFSAANVKVGTLTDAQKNALAAEAL